PDGRTWEQVPVQWSVTSRWGGRVTDATRPIKWAMARILGAEGGTYSLHVGGGAKSDLAPIASEDADGISVDAGTLRFQIPKKSSTKKGKDGKDVCWYAPL